MKKDINYQKTIVCELIACINGLKIGIIYIIELWFTFTIMCMNNKKGEYYGKYKDS